MSDIEPNTIVGTSGADTIEGSAGSDIIYGDPEPSGDGGSCETELRDSFPTFRHALSNVVLYLQAEDGTIFKVKIDNFSAGEENGLDPVYDPDSLNLKSFAETYYPDATLVAATIKAGANASGMGPGEGELFILDDGLSVGDLPVGAADQTYEYYSGNGETIFSGLEPSHCDPEEPVYGNDTIDGGRGNDIIYGGGGDDVLYGDTLYDFQSMAHAISNMVLYLENPDGEIVKVKIDSFDGSVNDANNVDFYGFIDSHYEDYDLVAATIKAGNNKSGMGPGEGELFILDDDVTLEELQAAGGKKGQADYTFDFAADLAPFGAPEENDTLVGGSGNDWLHGGVGADVFVFGDGDGNDTIDDFRIGEDRMDLTGVSGLSGFGELSMSQVGGTTVIALTSTDSVTLLGISMDQLSQDDFMFA